MNECLRDKNGNVYNPKVPRYESSYLIATISDKYSWSEGDYKLSLSRVYESVGNYFKLEEGKIKVLKDCYAVVSGASFMDGSAGEGYIRAHIKKNGKYNISTNLERIINRDFTCNSIPAMPLSLKKGDFLELWIEYASNTGALYVRQGADNTFLSVAKL